jgi:hypothetical protein
LSGVFVSTDRAWSALLLVDGEEESDFFVDEEGSDFGDGESALPADEESDLPADEESDLPADEESALPADEEDEASDEEDEESRAFFASFDPLSFDPLSLDPPPSWAFESPESDFACRASFELLWEPLSDPPPSWLSDWSERDDFFPFFPSPCDWESPDSECLADEPCAEAAAAGAVPQIIAATTKPLTSAISSNRLRVRGRSRANNVVSMPVTSWTRVHPMGEGSAAVRCYQRQ